MSSTRPRCQGECCCKQKDAALCNSVCKIICKIIVFKSMIQPLLTPDSQPTSTSPYILDRTNCGQKKVGNMGSDMAVLVQSGGGVTPRPDYPEDGFGRWRHDICTGGGGGSAGADMASQRDTENKRALPD